MNVLSEGNFLIYTEDGKIPKNKDVKFYKLKDNFVKIPSHSDPPETVFNFVTDCVSGIASREKVKQIWDEKLEVNKKISERIQLVINETSNVEKRIALIRGKNTIDQLQIPIMSKKQSLKIKNIGEGISKIIQSVLSGKEWGTQEEREKQSIKRTEIMEKLDHVWGLSKKMKEDMIHDGVEDVKDIDEKKYKLNKKQLLGIKYYDDFLNYKPSVEEILKQLPKKYEYGIYLVKDIFQITVKTDEDIKIVIKNMKIPAENKVTMNKNKFVGILNLSEGAVRIAITAVNTQRWGAVQAYYSEDSESYTIKASTNNMRLNEEGLFDIEMQVWINTPNLEILRSVLEMD